MNFSSIVGFLTAGGVLFFAVHEAGGSRDVILNIHAFMIVIGGTFAAACVCFPLSAIMNLSFQALKRLLGVGGVNFAAIIREVNDLAEGLRKDPNHMKTAIANVKNPFLKEGIELIINGVTEEQLVDIMGARIGTFKRTYDAEVNMFKTLGKFPPAFGLLGTTFGMIALLNQLGGADAQKFIGPAMAVGLVATLYGIALTNFIFIPIAENLKAASAESISGRQMVLQGLVMIKRKVHPLLVEEKMKSYLVPSARGKLVPAKA